MEGSVKALIVEDEPTLCTALEVSLEKMGYSPDLANTLKQAYERIKSQIVPYELILLDRHLPDGDSIELCSDLRRSGFNGLILMLTASGELNDRILGLQAGADDYLPKPFSWEELEARIKALAWRLRTQDIKKDSPSVTLHVWRLDPKLKQILTPRGWKKLTHFEYKLLSFLMEARGEPVSKEALLEQVWGLRILPKTRTIDWFIGRLRRLVEEDPRAPQHILTERGLGYFFKP